LLLLQQHVQLQPSQLLLQSVQARSNPNGTWNLIAIDNANLDLGTINNWSISIPSSTNAPCYGTGNSIPVTVTPAPAITFSPTTGSSGQTVAINGSGFAEQVL
jgi:subtilisin-like proprotein convertase family protein